MTRFFTSSRRILAVFAGLFWLVAAASGAETNPSAASALKKDWAFEPIARPGLPTVRDSSRVRNPIDAFVIARLEQKGLSLAPPAEKIALLRRVTFDLHGLPPSLDEIDAFLADTKPDAWSRVVERLLASPRYGERWGRHWLDVVRYGESHGFERDQIRDNAWRYRDYVVRSFNQDKPYAQFVTEQLAGDVLQPLTTEGIVATGFLVCGPWDEVGNNQISTVMKARVREEELEDMISVVSQTFLGVTVNCARCHNHKFDPIPQKDYYAIQAALAGVRPGDRPAQGAVEIKARDMESASLKNRIGELEQLIAAIEKEGRARISGKTFSNVPAAKAVEPIARWTFETNADDSVGHFHGELKKGATIQNGRLRLDGKSGFVETAPMDRDLRERTFEAWVTIPTVASRGGGIIGLETTGQGGVFDAIVFGEREAGKWTAGSEFFRRTRNLDGPAESAASNDLIHVAIAYAADGNITVYRNGEIYGEKYANTAGSGTELQTYKAGQAHILFGLRHTGAGNGFFQGEIEEARLYDRALTPAEVAASSANGPPVASRAAIVKALNPAERRQREEALAEVSRIQARLKKLGDPALAYAVNPRTPEPTFLLGRGDVAKPRDAVTAGALSAVKALPADFQMNKETPEAQRRLRLAEWITHRDNPLPPRVLVNRLWHYHFGRGLAGTPNDLGANGESPSHPELLEWMAGEFQARGGSLKEMHRLMLLSSAYQQSSSSPGADKAARIDSDNRWLWHFPLHRLEGEAIRDSMLSVSGNLNGQMQGPGFRPFTVFINNSHFYTLTDTNGPDFYRRSLYRINVQSARDPLLDSLDCPDPSTKTPARALTTTPIQALGLMNNAFVQRQAKDFAARLQKSAGADMRKQLELGWRLTYGRLPQSPELDRTVALAREHGLESVCWVLLNSSEFLYTQ